MISHNPLTEVITESKEKVIVLGEDHGTPGSRLLNYGKDTILNKNEKVALICESLNRKKNEEAYTIEEIMSSDINNDSKYFCINCINSGMEVFGSEDKLSKPKILLDECLDSKAPLPDKLKEVFKILEPIINYLKLDEDKFGHLLDLINDKRNMQNLSDIRAWSEAILKEFANMEQRLNYGDKSFCEVIISKHPQYDKCILFACGFAHLPGVNAILKEKNINANKIICYENNNEKSKLLLDHLSNEKIPIDKKLPLDEISKTDNDNLEFTRINLFYDCSLFIKEKQKEVSPVLSFFFTTKEESEILTAKKILSSITNSHQAEFTPEDLKVINNNFKIKVLYDDANAFLESINQAKLINRDVFKS